eukprot:TRINITY_DN2492_c0_g5_i1.p1 TRINITY_DN2492_c0_g5~~TRINITY_DN2492_c0_g5_i1.p1  ORF type:complete len:337 (-),score=49.80 TRINITY_DN2492_c0_g5_i1:95-1054(-)
MDAAVRLVMLRTAAATATAAASPLRALCHSDWRAASRRTALLHGCIGPMKARKVRRLPCRRMHSAAASGLASYLRSGALALSPSSGAEDRDELHIRLHAYRSNADLERLTRHVGPSAWLLRLEAALDRRGLRREEMEGHCAPEQLDFLRAFVLNNFDSRCGLRICQVGFNAGHSAVALLDSAPRGSTLLSLDLGHHEYTQLLERDVVQRCAAERGSRHILLLGDSAQLLPKFRSIAFDIVFIDGNHAYGAVESDVKNALALASANTLLLVNHVFTEMAESVGPTKAWVGAVRSGAARQLGWRSCCGRHGIAIGNLGVAR